MKSTEATTLRRWWVAVPITGSRSEAQLAQEGQRLDRFESNEGALSVGAIADWPLKVSLLATGNSALGRGARGAIPLNLVYESRNLELAPNKPRRWRIVLKVEGLK